MGTLSIVASDIANFMDRPPDKTYDLIWADPPYHEAPHWCRAIMSSANTWLAASGLLALEFGSAEIDEIKEVIDGFNIFKITWERKYGLSTIITVARVPNDDVIRIT